MAQIIATSVLKICNFRPKNWNRIRALRRYDEQKVSEGQRSKRNKNRSPKTREFLLEFTESDVQEVYNMQRMIKKRNQDKIGPKISEN